MEFAMMDEFVKQCENSGIKIINGYYYPTTKNKMVKNFYKLHGYVKTKEDDSGNSVWTLKISNYKPSNKVIEIL
jgi:predicted enzyme involved in methoxymalonyl-ACP biosynthesis